MRKVLALLCLNLLLPVHASIAERIPPESRTIFHLAEKAWAVGTVELGNPMPFRDGRILAFPSQIIDLLWAPNGTKPRNLMLVYEVATDDKDKPLFHRGDQVFGPIRVLPDHSYWRDNLPNTRRHEISGGRRYAFRGDQIPEAKKILGAYLAATEVKGAGRWKAQVTAVAAALGSPVAVLREDAVRFFAVYPNLGRDFDENSLPLVTAFLKSDAPVAEKASLIDSLSAAKVMAIVPALGDLSSGNNALAAAALRGLARLGQPVAMDRLMLLSRASSEDVRVFAVETLGMQAGRDDAAFERAREVLDAPTEPSNVREAAARGLGASQSEKVVPVLAAAVERGDASSRAAAEALAQSNSPEAGTLLAGILRKKTGEPALAAVAALGRMKNCPVCVTVLREQHEAHADEAVRQLIGIILEVPLEHKH